MAKINPAHPMTQRRIAAIKAALATEAINVHQLAERIALCMERTYDYLEQLVASEEVHIKRYAPPATGKQQPIAHYALGKGRNARRPDPLTYAQKAALRRARIYKDADRHDVFKARNRAQKSLAKVRKTPQSWLSALGA